MSKLILVQISEVKTAKDGRQYYVTAAQQAGNPFGGTAKRIIFQQFTAKSAPDVKNNDINPQWLNVATPGQAAAMIKAKTEFPGSIETRIVPTYQVNGEDRSTYTTIVFSRESVETVFKRAGHELPEKVEAATAEDLIEEPVIN